MWTLGLAPHSQNRKEKTKGGGARKLCIEWESTNSAWHINVHYVEIFCTHMKYNTMGILEWRIYGLNGQGSYGKVSYWFGGMCSKNKQTNTGLQGSTFLIIAWLHVLKSLHGLQGSTLSDHCITTGFKNTGLQGSTLSDCHMTTGREGEGGGGGRTSSMLLHWCYHQHRYLHQGWYLDKSCGYYSWYSHRFSYTSVTAQTQHSHTHCVASYYLI